MSGQATARAWQIPDGLEWTGPVDPWQRGTRSRVRATDVLREEQRGRELDREILALIRSDYYARLQQVARLRAVGVRARRPAHYSTDRYYVRARDRLVAPSVPLPRPARSRDPLAPGRIRRSFGTVTGCY